MGSAGVAVPDGFAVTSRAYFHFLEHNVLGGKIREALSGLDTDNVDSLQERGARVRALILGGVFPPDLEDAIRKSYTEMGDSVSVAVRSSATAEDLPDASFAGQQETFLNIRGASNVLESTKRCMASLFTNRAISYRVAKGFDHFDIGLSVGIQLMIQSHASGVMFTLDTESGFRDAILLSGSWGLGENVVQGAVNPDEWFIFKPTLNLGYAAILKSTLGSKEMTMTYAESNAAGKSVLNRPTPFNFQIRFCLSSEQVLTLAKWAVISKTITSVRWTLNGQQTNLACSTLCKLVRKLSFHLDLTKQRRFCALFIWIRTKITIQSGPFWPLDHLWAPRLDLESQT